MIWHMYCDNFDKVSAKLAFFTEDIQYKSFNSFCDGATVKLKNFQKGVGFSSFLTKRNSFIHEILNEVLEKTIPAGIPQYLLDYHLSLIFKEYEPVIDNEPKVLTVDDLTFGFVLWAVACGFAVVGFIFELLKFSICKSISVSFGLWIFVRIWGWGLKVFV